MRSPTAADLSPIGGFEERVMLAVLRTGVHAYGMAVRRELEAVTHRDVTIGSVYITLDRLEAKGLVVSKRAVVPKAPSSRRVFSITPLGVRVLAETRAIRDRLWAGVDLAAAARGLT
jgi:PadR family transcriptional regulator PadR